MTQFNDWQPELFNEFQAPTKPPWWARYWRTPQRFLVLRLAHEDMVLGAIGAIMVVMLGFCVGVERGKRIVVASVTPIPAALPPVGATPMLPAIRPPMAQPRVVAPAAAGGSGAATVGSPVSGPTKVVSSRYVVQVATYTARDQAVAAQGRLSQRGVTAALATKGKYHVLYASGFATYAQATAAADRLRTTYRDCFVRKQLAERG